MIYKRLYNGNVVVRSLCGSHPQLLDPATAITAAADQLRRVALHPNRLWDIAHALKQHAAAAVAAAAVITAASAAASSAAAAAEDRAPAEAAASSVPEAATGAAAEAESGCSPAQVVEPVTSAGRQPLQCLFETWSRRCYVCMKSSTHTSPCNRHDFSNCQ